MLLSLVSHKSFFQKLLSDPSRACGQRWKKPSSSPSSLFLLTLVSWEGITWRLLRGLLDVSPSPNDDLAVPKGSGHSPREKEWDW